MSKSLSLDDSILNGSSSISPSHKIEDNAEPVIPGNSFKIHPNAVNTLEKDLQAAKQEIQTHLQTISELRSKLEAAETKAS